MKETMLILHFIGLAMGVGTSFAHMFLGNTLSKLTLAEAETFKTQTKGLSLMGTVGTVVLLGSGIYLIIPYWPVILTLPLLIAKLVLFVVLVVLIILINLGARNNYQNQDLATLKRIELLGKISMVIGVAIVILAVNVFN